MNIEVDMVEKEKKILIFSPHSINDALLHQTLSEIAPNNLFLLGSNKILERDLNEYDKYYYKIKAYNEYLSSTVETSAVEIKEDFNFNRIVGYFEDDILRMARLRKLYNLPGQTYESALAFRDKFIMKSILTNAQILTPRFSKINTILDLIEFIQNYGFPVVVKPLRGSGSFNTFIVKSKDDLKKINIHLHFDSDHAGDYLAESFVEGTMYHIDGLVIQGTPSIIWPSMYVNNCIDYINGNFLGDYILHPSNPMVPRLIDYTYKVLEALPTPLNTGFHLEVFHTPDDQFIFCEIASRIGGGRINHMWKLCLGLDLKKEFIRLQADLPLTTPISKGNKYEPHQVAMQVKFPFTNWTQNNKRTPPPFPWINRFVMTDNDQELTSSTSLTSFYADAVFLAPTEEELFRRMRTFNNWFYSSN